jgi:pimeloyl-ACP methyl ester carboxylesterase
MQFSARHKPRRCVSLQRCAMVRLPTTWLVVTLVVLLASRLLSASSEALRESSVQANGLLMHYREAGQGTPLILLHGGGLTLHSWDAFAAVAAEHFRVISVDSRGHGHTDNPTHTFTYPLMAQDVAALITALQLEQPLVCGHSDGGIVALTFAKDYPAIPRAIVVYGAAPVHRDLSHYFAGMRRFFAIDTRGPLSEADLNRIAAERPEMVARYRQLHQPREDPEYWRALLKQIWPMWTHPLAYSPQELAAIHTPSLVLMGDRDEFFRVEEALQLARMLPKAELAVAPGASHTFFQDKPRLFQELVLDFLRRYTSSPHNSQAR